MRGIFLKLSFRPLEKLSGILYTENHTDLAERKIRSERCVRVPEFQSRMRYISKG